MKMKRKYKRRKTYGIWKVILTLVMMMTLTACGNGAVIGAGKLDTASGRENGLSELTVHYMDVGQGDAILLACGGEYMLIDAGDNLSLIHI